MNWYKTSQDSSLDSMFEEARERVRARGQAVDTQRITEPFTIELYRGFDADLDRLERQGHSYVLSPARSEQGVMWFTHMFISRNYDPIEYAKGKGKLLLTYPLQCQKHYDEVTYENGEKQERLPEDLNAQYDHTQNSSMICMFNYCLELPEGWFWSYKTEKFIVTTNTLVASPDMITKT